MSKIRKNVEKILLAAVVYLNHDGCAVLWTMGGFLQSKKLGFSVYAELKSKSKKGNAAAATLSFYARGI